MAIDNAYDAVNQQYPEEDEGVVGAISKVVGGAKELGVPIPPILAQLFTFLNSKSQQARQERGEAFIHLLVEDIQKHEAAIAKMRTEVNELQQAMSIALEYDVEEFNDLKRARYASVISYAVASETKVHDLASYIRDVEKLGERDLTGLKVLNRVMNREGDWKDSVAPSPMNPTRLHPNTFTHRAQELSVQMAQALTGDPKGTDGNYFSREDGLQICLRLQGFGLAQMVEVSPREVPNSNYAARPTTRGLMLLKLLGENVPNWNRYFGANGPL